MSVDKTFSKAKVAVFTSYDVRILPRHLPISFVRIQEDTKRLLEKLESFRILGRERVPVRDLAIIYSVIFSHFFLSCFCSCTLSLIYFILFNEYFLCCKEIVSA